MIESWYGTVMKIRSSCPYAVKRRGYVSGASSKRNQFPKTRFVPSQNDVLVHSTKPVRVGSDFFKRNDFFLVPVVNPVTQHAMPLINKKPFRSKFRINFAL